MDVHSALRREVVSSTDGLQALEPDWWKLWRRCPPATPFQSPAWLIPWWRAFEPGKLATVAVWQDGALVGLAPFYLEQSGTGSRLLPVGISLSDYLDVLIDPACEEQVAASIVNAMLALEWDDWDFEELRPEAQAWALLAAPPLSGVLGQPIGATPQSTCPVVPFSGSPDLSGFVPPRRRQSLRTARAAVARRGYDIAEMQAGQTDAFLDAFFRLHALRWAERGEQGVLADPAVQRFHRAALPRLAAAGLARCFLISIGGELAGAYNGFHHGTRAFYYLGGFNPAFGKESPGAILIGHAMTEALEQGASEFHFLRGQEAYKYSWGAADRWNKRCRISRSPLDE